MEIVRAKAEDAEVILQIQKTAYLSEAKINDDYNIPPLTQTLEEIKEEFNTCTFLKAVINDQIVGSVKGSAKGDTCYIGRLITRDEFQNRGIGTMLLKQIEKEFQTVSRYELFTGKNSEKNLYLYRKNGYTIFNEQALSEKTTIVFMEKFQEEEKEV